MIGSMGQTGPGFVDGTSYLSKVFSTYGERHPRILWLAGSWVHALGYGSSPLRPVGIRERTALTRAYLQFLLHAESKIGTDTSQSTAKSTGVNQTIHGFVHVGE